MPPFSSVGTTAARIGTCCFPVGSMETSGSKIRRSIAASVVLAARSGFSVFGEL
jgi:hypothetical protein